MLDIVALKKRYSNEEIFVILLTRYYFNKASKEELNLFLLSETIDWSAFYELVTINSIRSFAFGIVSELNLPINKQVYDALKKDYVAITFFSSHQRELTKTLINKFKAVGKEVIVYKGVHLADNYYKNANLRESSDIDFFIDIQDYDILEACLLANGAEPRYKLNKSQMDFFKKHFREHSFKSPINNFNLRYSVELQWRVIETYIGKFPSFNFFIVGRNSSLDVTKDFLLVSSHHLIREHLLRFKYLIDLACILEKDPHQVDWQLIESTFKSNHFSNFLNSGLTALNEILGVEIPLKDYRNAHYKLFSFDKLSSPIKNTFKKFNEIGAKLTYGQKIKFKTRAYLSIFIPNAKDLANTNYPRWAFFLISPVKTINFLYKLIRSKQA